MKIGMDIKVCDKTECEFKDETYGLCMLTCGGNKRGCPIPDNCPYKNLHIIRCIPLDVCGEKNECPVINLIL